MTKREREIAEFFMKLASIPTATEAMTAVEAERFETSIARHVERQLKERPPQSHARVQLRSALLASGLDRLPARELAALQRRFLQLATALQRDLARVPRRAHTLRQMRVAGALALDLPRLHKRVRSTLTNLLREGSGRRSVLLAPDAGLAVIDATDLPATYLVRKKNVVLARADPDAVASAQFLAEFVRLLTQKPCPLGRCPVCARFFVRVRRQIYCSRRCGSRATEEKRRGTRRPYMRKLMRMKRELARKRLAADLGKKR